MINYNECKFNEIASCAELYGLSLKTARVWAAKSVEPVPWHDPVRVLEWYRVAFNRAPGKRVRDRVAVLGPQFMAARAEHGEVGSASPLIDQGSGISDQGEQAVELRAMMDEVLGVLGSAGTVASIAREEREAYEKYLAKKDAGLGSSVEFRSWQDLTKTKREWMKTPDSVEVALRALKFWIRGEWEQQWKTLRTALDGRRMGSAVRESLLAVADDPLEWRRVWDMELERVIGECLMVPKESE